MSTTKRKGWLQASRYITGLVLAAGILPAAANATTTLSLEPATQNVAVGGGFDLALNISGLGTGSGESLSAFDLNVHFNSTLVQFDSFTPGTGLGILAWQGAGSSGGVANPFAVSDELPSTLDGSQPGAFLLGTLHFTSLDVGNAAFSVSINELADSFGAALDPTPELKGANVIITGSQTVPDGGPGLMAALSFGALMLAHRKLRQQQGTPS